MTNFKNYIEVYSFKLLLLSNLFSKNDFLLVYCQLNNIIKFLKLLGTSCLWRIINRYNIKMLTKRDFLALYDETVLGIRQIKNNNDKVNKSIGVLS